jgi:hypothetical protein
VTEILKKVIKTIEGPYEEFIINWSDGAKSTVNKKNNRVDLTGISGEKIILNLDDSQHGTDCIELINRSGYAI